VSNPSENQTITLHSFFKKKGIHLWLSESRPIGYQRDRSWGPSVTEWSGPHAA
jgi:hypothetical protein